ncbi:MAG: hypothetical protein AB7T27_07040 [Kiritimatiellia bacterium]
MKPSPDMQRLEEILRSSKIAGGGFLGSDRRPLEEILEADAAELVRLGHTRYDIADRMRHISALAERGLGSWVKVDENIEAAVTDTRGKIPCPWPHPGTFSKTVVTAKNMRTGQSIQWSELNIHLIEMHGFFEGHGSPFRLDPAVLAEILF